MTTDFKSQRDKRHQGELEKRFDSVVENAISLAKDEAKRIREAVKITLSSEDLKEQIRDIEVGNADAANREGMTIYFNAFNQSVGDTRAPQSLGAVDRIAHEFIVDAIKLTAVHSVASVAKTMVRYRHQDFKGLDDQAERFDEFLGREVDRRVDYFRANSSKLDVFSETNPSIGTLNEAYSRFSKAKLSQELDGHFYKSVLLEIKRQMSALENKQDGIANFASAPRKTSV